MNAGLPVFEYSPLESTGRGRDGKAEKKQVQMMVKTCSIFRSPSSCRRG